MSDSQFSLWQPSSWWNRSTYPTFPLLGLSDDEVQLIETLRQNALTHRSFMELSERYYLGEQIIQNLRIAIPKELEFLRTIVGWPAMAVDPYVERLHADGFRLPTATDADEHISELLDANCFDSEQSLAYTDALSMGRGYWVVGSPLEDGDAPRITVESPLNMSVLWAADGQTARAAMQEYWAQGRLHGLLMVPGMTIELSKNDKKAWEIVNRDEHDHDFVPVVRMPHRARTHDRDGRSAISNALRSYTDMGCRTLLGLEVAREIYSVPKQILLGATEADFQNSDGTAKTAWETYITRVLALERDDEGNIPDVKQLQAYDPGVFTKLLDWYASAAAGEVAATPQDMGLYTQGNPASAEAVQAGENRRDRRAENMQQQFGGALIKVAQYALRFEAGGTLPDEYRSLAVDWSPATRPIPGLTSTAVAAEIASGAIPPTSDVTLKRLGYSAVERRRLAQDRNLDGGASVLAELAHSLIAKDARTDKAVQADIAGPTTPPTAAASGESTKPSGV